MTMIGELNEKHAALLAKVRELRDAHKGKEMPAEKSADVDRLLDEADGVKASLEVLVAETETKPCGLSLLLPASSSRLRPVQTRSARAMIDV